MLSNIKISLLVLAYSINVFHDLYPHEHSENDLLNQSSFINTIIDKVIDLDCFVDNQDDFHHDHDTKVPFPHQHLSEDHTLIQYSTNSNYYNCCNAQFLFSEINYDFKLLETIIQKVFISDKQIFYDYLLSKQENLRAPPKEFKS